MSFPHASRTRFRSTHAVLAAALALTLGGAALAQVSAPPAPTTDARQAGRDASPRTERAERMVHHHAERQQQLRQALALTPEQEPAWQAYVARMTPPSRPTASADAAQPSTTPERLARMERFHAEHQAHMKARHEAIRSFYAALTPAQQKIYDDHHAAPKAQGGPHRHAPGGMGMGHHGMQGGMGKGPRPMHHGDMPSACHS